MEGAVARRVGVDYDSKIVNIMAVEFSARVLVSIVNN